jgi:hypothetical protein
MMSIPPGPNRDWADALAKIIRLEGDCKIAFATLGVDFPPPPPEVPPSRDALQSSHDWAKLADKAAEAVKEGIRLPNTTPEEMVRKVIADEEARRAQAKEFDRLRKDEDKRIMDATQAKLDRRKILLSTIRAVLGGLATFGALEAVKSLLALHR